MEGKGKGRLCFPLTEAESVPTTHNPHPLSLCPYTHTYPHTRSGSLKGTPNGSPARHSLLSFLLPGVSHTRKKNVSSPPQNKMWAPYSGLGSPWGKAAGEPGPAHAQSWQRAPGPAGPWPRGGLGTRILQGTDGHILGFLERPRPRPRGMPFERQFVRFCLCTLHGKSEFLKRELWSPPGAFQGLNPPPHPRGPAIRALPGPGLPVRRLKCNFGPCLLQAQTLSDALEWKKVPSLHVAVSSVSIISVTM